MEPPGVLAGDTVDVATAPKVRLGSMAINSTIAIVQCMDIQRPQSVANIKSGAEKQTSPTNIQTLCWRWERDRLTLRKTK